jgi:hypothetical protein
MPWILLFISLLCAPLQAATIPGITSPAANSASSTQSSEPSVEQKKAAYAALADVLENDDSRKELIDQLRKVASTPPQEPVPVITPPEVKEQKTVLENVTEVSGYYGDALASRFAQLYRNITGSPHKAFNPQPSLMPPATFYYSQYWFLLSGYWYVSALCRSTVGWVTGEDAKTANAGTGCSCPP